MSPPIPILCSSVVLMPFDGSPQSIWTFPLAHTIARAMEGSLHLVLPGDQTGARELLLLPAELRSQAIHHELRGDPAACLARLAAVSPDAFIVTPSYSGLRPDSGLGAFQEALLQQADCPVLLVQPGATWTTWRPARILVPQDGSPDAAKALCPAARLAERSGAEVLILHVSAERPCGAPEPGILECPAYVDHPEHEWPEWVAAFLDRVRSLCSLSPHATLRFEWALGDPGQEIVAAAQRTGADLISVTWHRSLEPGRSQIVRQVVREAPCPVLLLPCHP
jgi:nucleotide-binding universal stress UspA family protein